MLKWLLSKCVEINRLYRDSLTAGEMKLAADYVSEAWR